MIALLQNTFVHNTLGDNDKSKASIFKRLNIHLDYFMLTGTK